MCALSSGSLSRCECGGLESRMEKGSSTHSFNGLKFGKKIYFEGVGSGLQPKIGGEEEEEEEDAAAPPRSPAKKGRTGVGQGGQPPRCQVEGCKVDLSGAKAYYCRHKVCGVHSKSPMVIVAGLEQRFCQQCSRFHQLPEFDQGKRSCRRRLAGHNERRRKPPPGPLLSSRNAILSPSIFDNHFKTGGVVTTDFTSNCQLPWESSSQPPPPPPPPLPNLLQPSTTRPCYTDEDCISGIADSTSSALSLLSNWGSRTQPLDLGVNTNFLATDVAQPSLDPAARYSWDFKGDHDHDHADDNSLHDMGLLPRMSHPTNTPYGRDLGLARPGDVRHHGIEQPGGFDSSLQHINWSL